MQKGKSLSTPLPPYLKLTKDDCPKSNEEKAIMAKLPYALACGSLMYAMVATRSNIAYAVGVVIVGLCQILERSIGKLSSQFSNT